MPKAIRKDTSSTPFQFARQFTAPPFFMGLEDAKLKSQLLLDAVKKSGKETTQVSSTKKRVKKKAGKKAEVKQTTQTKKKK